MRYLWAPKRRFLPDATRVIHWYVGGVLRPTANAVDHSAIRACASIHGMGMMPSRSQFST